MQVGKQHHIDYHIWLALHELTHVLVFDDSLYPDYIDPSTMKRLGIDNVITTLKIKGKPTKFIKTPKVIEKAKAHFDCDRIKGVPLENNGLTGNNDAHWKRRAMNSDYMIAQSFGENLISDITLALFEDSGWYRVNYDLSNLFLWGKGKGCKFIYGADCYTRRHVNLQKMEFDIQSQFPREFCSNLNRPICSPHHIFRGNCLVMEYEKNLSTNERPFNNARLAGVDKYLDRCPSVKEEKYGQKYYGGSCRVGVNSILKNFEMVCPDCACFITKSSVSLDNKLAKSKAINLKKYIKDKENLSASCLKYKCVNKELYVVIANKEYKCDQKKLMIKEIGGYVKCHESSVMCSEKYKCKFGCVEKYQ